MKINKYFLAIIIFLSYNISSLGAEDKPNITPAPRISVDEVVLYSNPEYDTKTLFKIEYIKKNTGIPKPRIKPSLNNNEELLNMDISINNTDIKKNNFIVPDFWGF